MLIFDRYLLRTFLRVLLVSFCSLTGLFIVIDLFGNLEEFISYSERSGSLAAVLIDYYGPRILSFFDRTSALLALIAAVFAITWLQRTNEMTAVMAAGIRKSRIIRPIVIATVIIAVLAAVNREVLLPKVRDKLSRNAQDWLGETAKRLDPRYDFRTKILIGGQHTLAADQSIINPSFRLPAELSRHFGRQLVAERALYRGPSTDHPGGYLLIGVSQPDNIDELPSGKIGEEAVVLCPHDIAWLEPDQCFVTSNVTFTHLAAGNAWRQYSSSAELIEAIQNPSLEYGVDTRVTLHARFLQPLLDVTLLFLGLPLVLTRSDRNIFVAAGKCLGLVALFFLVVLTCQAMGKNSFLLSPALAAWCPLLIFLPTAYTLAQRKWE
jgi:lipopolysaccharide export system permease protein